MKEKFHQNIQDLKIDCGEFSIEILQLEDAESLNAMLLKNIERFQRYFPVTLSENKSIDDSLDYIKSKKKQIQTKTEFVFGLRDKVSSEVIGLLIIKNIDYSIQDAEVAYCLDVDFGGKGIITRVVKKILTFSKEEIGLKTLFIIVNKDNLPSIGVANNSGFVWKKTLLKQFKPTLENDALDMEKFVIKL